MDDAFSKFADSEASIWATHSDNVPSRDLLVRVSGSLQSPIAHHAHQPSFTTLRPRNGETVDETNPCIAIIMGNAFDSLRLWGEYDDICIFLDRESNYSNAQ